jgi:drug/metabolite transporter (DMT)-like permease
MRSPIGPIILGPARPRQPRLLVFSNGGLSYSNSQSPPQLRIRLRCAMTDLSHSARDLRGILFALATFTFWVFADSSIKGLGKSSLPAYEILAFMGLFVSAAIALYALLRRQIKRLKPVNARHQAVRSLLDLVNNFCVVVALRHVTLPLFYILVFMSPLVITLLAATFLFEKIGLGRVLAALSGFAGVVIAVNPFSASRQGDGIGLLACMVCVACFSVNMVWSRVLTRTETPESLAFFSGVVMIVAGFGCMLFHAQPVGGFWLLALLAMGLFCAAGSICFFVALKHTNASTVSQYHYTQLLTGSLVSWLIWHQLPTLSMIIGGTLIVAAGLYVALPRPRTA